MIESNLARLFFKKTLPEGIIEGPFDDFLKFYFPETVNLFDFNRKFVFLDKELEQLFPQQQDDFSSKYVDNLVKVFTKKSTKELSNLYKK